MWHLSLLNLIISILYFFIILSFAIGWKSKKEFTPANIYEDNNTFISVVIALRNEALNITTLLKILKQQSLSKEFYEIILVNDHSTDNSVELIEAEIKNTDNIYIYSLPENKTGKKEALNLGIRKSKGELVAFTDADCLPGMNWLQNLQAFYLDKNKPDLIIGLVDLSPSITFLEKIFRLEFLSLILSSAGSTSLNHPMLCNGANLAVKRSEITNINVYNPKKASGDDVFLLHNFKSRNKKIELLKSHQHLIITNPPKTLKEFFSQRIRWGAKAPAYKDVDTIFLTILIVVMNISLCFLLTGSIIVQNYKFLITIFSIKTISDFSLFLSGSKFFNFKKNYFHIFLLAFIYPFYIFLVSLIIIKKPFHDWKGRNISK